jgi:uncharacterized protein
MRVQHCTDLQTFYDRVLPYLQQREAEHNMLLSYLGDLLRQPAETPPGHTYMGYVKTEAGEIVAAAHYGGYRFFLTHPTSGYEQALGMLVTDAASPVIERVVLPTEFGSQVQDQWTSLTGRQLVVDMPMGVYRLDTVKAPTNVAGTMRWVTSADETQMLKWMIAFQIDTFGADPANIDQARLSRWLTRLTSNEMYGIAFWEVDGQSVSMSATIGRSPTGMRIGMVYTPPEQRGHGYASALVAAQSQWLLDSGLQFCTLNTDLANPTSNKIYQSIGYYLVGEQTMYEVEPVEVEESR